MRARLRPSFLAAGAWTVVAAVQARRLARRGDLLQIRLLRPPPLPAVAGGAVVGMLGRLHASCLVRSLVLQAWHAAHNSQRDVVVGVRRTGGMIEAHAWLEGDQGQGDYIELVRRPAKAESGAHGLFA